MTHESGRHTHVGAGSERLHEDGGSPVRCVDCGTMADEDIDAVRCWGCDNWVCSDCYGSKKGQCYACHADALASRADAAHDQAREGP